MDICVAISFYKERPPEGAAGHVIQLSIREFAESARFIRHDITPVLALAAAVSTSQAIVNLASFAVPKLRIPDKWLTDVVNGPRFVAGEQLDSRAVRRGALASATNRRYVDGQGLCKLICAYTNQLL